MIDELLPTEVELEALFDSLWPICRSLTGDGFRASLALLQQHANYEKVEIPTGKAVHDWRVPREWNIREAYVENEAGERVIDFSRNNLHVLGYSIPVDEWLSLEELQPHLYSLPEQPDAIPYLTSYYKERWGFCLAHRARQSLATGRYHAVIRSRLEDGHMTLGEGWLPANEVGQRPQRGEILLSTYLCHPSMANNELSGPLVTTFIYRALSRLESRRFDYRFAVVPETIGAIAYLCRHGETMKRNLHAGYVVTCVGDERKITYKKSRRGNTVADRVALQELQSSGLEFDCVDFFPGGSDERQYCSPGYDLPVGSLVRSMYGRYPEYHTSLDDKSFISMAGLRGSVRLYLRTLLALEANRVYVNTLGHGEPMLGPRGLYPTLGSQKDTGLFVEKMMWILNQADGTNDLCAIAGKAGCSVLDLSPIARELLEKGLLKEARE